MVSEMAPSLPFIEGRGEDFCRGCLGKELFSALDLGNLPIANELLIAKHGVIENIHFICEFVRDVDLGKWPTS